MKKYLALLMFAVLGVALLLSLSAATTSAFAQDAPYSEEYMAQHDGGDRAEYLQEMEYSDPWFHVPPVNDASLSTTTSSNVPTN
jgi:hypothetical protein